MAPPGEELVPAAGRLLESLERGEASAAVIGLGYVGLPLALALAKGGLRVTGLEADPGKAEAVMAGRSYIVDASDGEVGGAVRSGRLSATTDPECLAGADVIIICVPTPLRKTRDPDISFILEAVGAVAPRLRRGQLVILESTSYPGTTRELVLPRLEEGGLRAGEDFFLAFSPERIDPGNPRYGLGNTPKVVGGVTPACARLAAAVYSRVTERVMTLSSTEAAEMAKLLENTFRAVNIGLVNEMAMICRKLGLDVWEVIEAAATKPFGFMPFQPGPGLGGHCIPVDPHYLSWKMRALNYTARFIELAGEINSGMPGYVVDLVTSALNARGKPVKGTRILVMGVAYKKDVSDVRESPALDVIKLLLAREAAVSYHDPHVPDLRLDGLTLSSSPLEEALAGAECLVVVTNHSCFDWVAVMKKAPLVVDTRNALAAAGITDPSRIVRL